MAPYPYHEADWAGATLMLLALRQHGVADTFGRATMDRNADAPAHRTIPRRALVDVSALPVPAWPVNAYCR